MADQDVESRLVALEGQVAKLKGGSAFRPISPFTAKNPMFFRPKSLDNRQLRDRTRSVFAGLFSATARTGSPAIANQGTNTRYRAWGLDSASTEDINFEVLLPTDFVVRASGTPVTPYLWYANVGAGTGAVMWTVTIEPVLFAPAAQNNLNDTGAETVITEAQTVGAQDVITRSGVASTSTVTVPFVVGERPYLRCTVGRLGANVNDTLGNDVGLLAFEITYTADM